MDNSFILGMIIPPLREFLLVNKTPQPRTYDGEM